VAGRLLLALDAARLARALAMMLASRVPLLEALALCQPGLVNHQLRAGLGQAIAAVREGASLGSALRRAGGFPPLLVTMVASGDAAGRLDVMLDRAAAALEADSDTLAATALAVLEPAIILVMGAMVATIVLAILLPILQLESLVRT
jgi:general secretion pathway protein F